MLEGYETAVEAAERLGITDSQVRRLAGEGRIPGATKVAGAWFIPRGVQPIGQGKRGPKPRWRKQGE